LLKPINSIFESVPTENFVSTEVDFDVKMLDECGCREVHGGLNKMNKAAENVENYGDISDCQTYFKKIDDNLFIDGVATKFDLRHFNFLAIKEI
jgi:hypothetical protein